MDQPEGIRIHDADLAISPSGLEALIRKEGVEVQVSKLDLSISQAGLNALLRSNSQDEGTAPAAVLQPGATSVTLERDGKPLQLDLRIAGLSLELGEGTLRLVTR